MRIGVRGTKSTASPASTPKYLSNPLILNLQRLKYSSGVRKHHQQRSVLGICFRTSALYFPTLARVNCETFSLVTCPDPRGEQFARFPKSARRCGLAMFTFGSQFCDVNQWPEKWYDLSETCIVLGDGFI
jgi:hypothetical protein